MSSELAQISERIGTVHQLGAVVNAMRGIAGARAQQSRARLPAIRAYAATVVRAIAVAQGLLPSKAAPAERREAVRPGLIVFGTEQGFAGAFVEQALEAAVGEFASARVFLLGTRTVALAAERNLAASWTQPLPSGVAGIADTALAVVNAVYAYLAEVGAAPIAMLYPLWHPGHGSQIVRRSLLPLAPSAMPVADGRCPPLTNLAAEQLLERLSQEYLFAQLCEATAECFAAENEARAATMAAAHTHIDEKLRQLQSDARLLRQESITAEVVELAAGVRGHV